MLTLGNCIPFWPALMQSAMAPQPTAIAPRDVPAAAIFRPYGDDAALRGGLGFVVSPGLIIRTENQPVSWHPGPTPYQLNQYVASTTPMTYDAPAFAGTAPVWRTRREARRNERYIRKQNFGWVPGDDALATRTGCYQPVRAGWLNLERAAAPPLGVTDSPPMTFSDLTLFQRISIGLSLASTIAIVANAGLNIWRNIRPASAR